MRITSILCRQHIGFMFKKHWLLQGKRTPSETGAEQILQAKGVNVTDVHEYLNPTRTKLDYDPNLIVGYLPRQEKLDETNKNWHSKECYLFRDSNVLLEGVRQAQVLLKAIVINELPVGLEESLTKQSIPTSVDLAMQQSVMAACVFDAEQNKTAIVKIPERPAYVLPRDYGITDARRNRLLIAKLINNCEKLAGSELTKSRKVLSDAFFVVPVEKEGDLIQFEVNADTFMSAKTPIASFSKVKDVALPNIFPIKHTISIPTDNIYKQKRIYPIYSSSAFSHPHTIMIHFSPLDVKNQFEEMVTPTQFESRAMVKAFTAAAAKANELYGADIKELPTPIVVQCVHTNGQTFHFGVFQLNTLDLNGQDGTKNYWFTRPNINLYDECAYKSGRPVLEGYNADVLRLMNVFYNNQ